MLKYFFDIEFFSLLLFSITRFFFDFGVYGVTSHGVYSQYSFTLMMAGALSFFTLGATNGLNFVLPTISGRYKKNNLLNKILLGLAINFLGTIFIFIASLISMKSSAYSSNSIALIFFISFSQMLINYGIVIFRNLARSKINKYLILLSCIYYFIYVLFTRNVDQHLCFILLGVFQIILTTFYLVPFYKSLGPLMIDSNEIKKNISIIIKPGLKLVMCGQLFFILANVDKFIAYIFFNDSFFARLSFLSSISSIIVGISSMFLSVKQPNVLRSLKSMKALDKIKFSKHYIKAGFYFSIFSAFGILLILSQNFFPIEYKYQLNITEYLRVLASAALVTIFFQSSFLQYMGKWRDSIIFLGVSCLFTFLCCLVYALLFESDFVGLSSVYFMSLILSFFSINYFFKAN